MKSKPNIAIEITNLTKNYFIQNGKPFLINRLLGTKNQELCVLNKVNLTIKKGERVGLVGPNGSGKTTLLKIITGIAKPTQGSVQVNGRLVSLIDLEAGFNPDLTGSENIHLNGMLIGMTKKEIDARFDAIVKFSEIERFINAPLFTYSSGMKFRLAFSIAMASKCTILLIDEVFVVGDVNFQKKTASFIKEAQRKFGITTLISSHVPLMIWSFADKFYKIESKKLKHISKSAMKRMIKSESRSWEKIHVDYRKI